MAKQSTFFSPQALTTLDHAKNLSFFSSELFDDDVDGSGLGGTFAVWDSGSLEDEARWG